MGGSRATKEHLSASKENAGERGGKQVSPFQKARQGKTVFQSSLHVGVSTLIPTSTYNAT